MSTILKNIVEKSGKQTTVHFEGKEERAAFDESFEKAKMDIAAKFIGYKESSRALATKLSE